MTNELLPAEPGLYLDKNGQVWRRSALGAKHPLALEAGFTGSVETLAFQAERGPFTLLVAGPAPFELEAQRARDESDRFHAYLQGEWSAGREPLNSDEWKAANA